MPKESKSKWMRLRDVARELGVNYWTVWKWVKAGSLPTRRTPGGQHMALRTDVEGLYR